MQYKKFLHLAIVAGAIISLLVAASTDTNFVYAQAEKFKAKLKGENEVPQVNSTATGKAKFKVKDEVITSKVNITGITDVTSAHIHAGMEGQNGEPIVDLLKTGNQSDVEDTFTIDGEITASDLQGPMAGKTIQDLQTAMGNEETYVNIHTNDNPDGEIRGQIKASGANDTKADSMSADVTALDEESEVEDEDVEEDEE